MADLAPRTADQLSAPFEQDYQSKSPVRTPRVHEAAAAAEAPPSPRPAVLRLRGIPFAAQEASILEFFAQAEGVRQPLEVYICRRNGGRRGFEAAGWAALSPAPTSHNAPL
jgi:hypothetical protein